MNGLQRTCPKCAELNEPTRPRCQTCGAWLIDIHQYDKNSPEYHRIMDDLHAMYRATGTSIVGDPELGDTGPTDTAHQESLESKEDTHAR